MGTNALFRSGGSVSVRNGTMLKILNFEWDKGIRSF